MAIHQRMAIARAPRYCLVAADADSLGVCSFSLCALTMRSAMGGGKARAEDVGSR